MEAGQLFVSMGIKGTEKSVADILGVQKGLAGAAAAGRDVKSALSDFGIKGAEHTVAGLIGMQKEFEETSKAAHDAHEALDDFEHIVPDDQITILADMRESLNKIAEASSKAKAAVGEVKPKDPEKTKGQLEGFKKGLKDVSSLSFEAKAAIVGAMYALERLFATSSQAGTNLTNFSATLGVSAKTLQQYQYAARQVGVSNEEMASTFGSLQATMTKALLGQGAPKGLARVSLLTGGMTAGDLDKFAKQPELLLQKLQEYAQKEKNAGLRNDVLKSFGLGDGAIAALTRNAFRPEVMAKAPTYSDGEVKSLDKTNAAWSNLGTKIEMAFGHLNAKHGGELIGDISKIVDSLTKLSEALLVFAEKAKIFEWIGKSIQGWTLIFQGATDATKAIEGAMDDPKKAEQFKEDAKTFFTNDLPNYAKELIGDVFGETPKGAKPKLKVVGGQHPAAPTTSGGAAGGTQNVEINQNLNFNHDGTDPKKTGDSTRKAVKDAFRQLPAQAQGS